MPRMKADLDRAVGLQPVKDRERRSLKSPSMSWGAVGGRKCNFPTKLAPPILSQRSSLCSVCGMPLGDMSSKKAQYGCGDGFANELIGRTFKCCVISVGHLGLGFGWCGEASNLAGMC